MPRSRTADRTGAPQGDATPTTLCCWLGHTDLDAMAGRAGTGLGPIAGILQAGTFPIDRVVLVDGQSDPPRREQADRYPDWLKERLNGPVHVHRADLAHPNDLQAIARAARDAVAAYAASGARIYHLSPGTPVMAACWIILAKTEFPATLIATSSPPACDIVDFPDVLPADLLASILQSLAPSSRVFESAIDSDAFAAIRFRSESMRNALALATRLAPHDVPVLILGETGTGKELLAQGIHRASRRRSGPFVAVNCGAIPESIAESLLFGHHKGAFTGASTQHRGHFEEAHGGSIFLDEVGDLSPAMQVRLLRVLQEGEIHPLGAAGPTRIDVRVIAATHHDLLAQDAGFRQDLLHRLAVGVVKLTPLRERPQDLQVLIDTFLEKVNIDAAQSIGDWEARTLTPGARDVLRDHPWPGNVRELEHTIRRLVILASSPRIRPEEVRSALLPIGPSGGDRILHRPLGDGFRVEEVVEEVERHYVVRALESSGHVKSEAARLLGLKSGQTFSNWMERLGIDGA